ncbi:MAG: O-antigen ligase family protein [Solirubrobacteraceae bacterium]|jgi:O-antigen ligase
MSAHAAPASTGATAPSLETLVQRAISAWGISAAIAVAVALICFRATGGLDLGPATDTEMALTLGSGALVALAFALDAPSGGRIWGTGTAAALFALAMFTALSVAWSVQPNHSWIEANRTLSYAASFAGAIALVRLFPTRWRSVLAGVLLATVYVSGYAVATKVFPATLNPSATLARLNAVFNYWNAVGLTAALGVPACLWLGSRREGHGVVAALAPAAVCLLLVTILLAYSRGALLALGVGLALWFVFTPLRLRAAAVLAIGAIGAAPVIAWTFAQPALTTDVSTGPTGAIVSGPSLALRDSAGHELGLLLLGAFVACIAASLVVRFAALRTPPSAHLRRRLGIAVLVVLALMPASFAISLAASQRGLFGSISHDWNTLTSTSAPLPGNSATRLTQLGSIRALYWSDALKIWNAHPVAGVGAGGFQTAFLEYAPAGTLVEDAHGYVVQTLADLGLIGLALSLIVAALWLAAVARTAGPFRRGANAPGTESAERIGLLTMIAIVAIFVVHSSVDITWFVPGDAVIALLCAGWVAGRGPHGAVLARGRLRLDHLRHSRIAALGAAAAILLAVVVAWAQWQPLRSQDSATAALIAQGNGDTAAAIADEKQAFSIDPLDYQPLQDLGYSESDAAATARQPAVARSDLLAGQRAFARAVQLEPSNPFTWYYLALFDFIDLNSPSAAVRDVAPALHLYPNYIPAQTLYLKALASAQAQAAAAARRRAAAKRAAARPPARHSTKPVRRH